MNNLFPSEKRGVSIKQCTCHHPYQDALYGKNMRVHNRMAGGGVKGIGKAGWRCTVCGTMR